ncbi:MAG TPA: hypothetical protein VKU00_20225 [Chthonomonadaceae bacterium]|nr:hypothetical protein [Chthonomonadaceae bacterium]
MERRHVWASLSVLCLIAFVVLTWIFWPRPRLLLPLSKRITPSFAWEIDHSDLEWISDHEAVLVQQDTAKHWQLSRLDTLHRTLVPDTKLTTLFQQSQASSPIILPSPDGKWLLWYIRNSKALRLTTPDATHVTNIPIPLGQYGGWVDDRHWATYMNIENLPSSPNAPSLDSGLAEIKVYGVDNPQHPHRIMASDISTVYDPSLTFPSPNLFFICDWQPLMPAEKLMLEEHPMHIVGAFHAIWIHLPKNDAVNMVTFSPKGERMALLLSRERPGPISQMIHRIIPAYPVKTSNVVSLYVCHRNGKDMKEIGMIMDGAPVDDPAGLDTDSLRWLPSGKQLSYVYKGVTYLVAVDP